MLPATIPWNGVQPATVFWLPARTTVGPVDPFGGWTAQDEKLYNEMRPAVPGLTS